MVTASARKPKGPGFESPMEGGSKSMRPFHTRVSVRPSLPLSLKYPRRPAGGAQWWRVDLGARGSWVRVPVKGTGLPGQGNDGFNDPGLDSKCKALYEQLVNVLFNCPNLRGLINGREGGRREIGAGPGPERDF